MEFLGVTVCTWFRAACDSLRIGISWYNRGGGGGGTSYGIIVSLKRKFGWGGIGGGIIEAEKACDWYWWLNDNELACERYNDGLHERQLHNGGIKEGKYKSDVNSMGWIW